jgi:arylsulfatase A-like enzyme
VNVSTLHSPNRHYLRGAREDSRATQRAALAYVDRHIGGLLRALAARHDCWVILCSDHGTAYGEDGYVGHRLAHPTVWTVPYAEAHLPQGGGAR